MHLEVAKKVCLFKTLKNVMTTSIKDLVKVSSSDMHYVAIAIILF